MIESRMTEMSAPGQARTGRSRKKVLVVDDHPMVRLGLASMINQEPDLTVCGEADSERSALSAAQEHEPDIAIVDWSLKTEDATGVIVAFRERYPRMAILVLSMHEEMFYAERALRAGANGYIMKQAAAEKIIEAIRRVAAGQPYLSERMAQTNTTIVRPLISEKPAPAHHPDTTESIITTPLHNGPQPNEQTKKIAVSIVIPVYNSEATVESLCEQLIRELNSSYQLQIVLVDDGSNDRSAAVCQRIQDRHPTLVDSVVLTRNFGEHNAVMAGLNCAEGDYCVIMDDDFQNPPEEVRKLIEEIRKGHDVVYVRYEAKRHSLFRNLGSRLHNWMATRALGKPADLYLSSFKAISRPLLQEIVRYTGPNPYVDAIILRTTRRIGVVKVRHGFRTEGHSGYTFGKLVSLWSNMFVAFSLYPLRLMGLLGGILLVAGTGYGLYTLIALAVPSIPNPDQFQQANAVNWFFRGLTLLAVGIVGEYVGRIYMHLTRDPQFIIRTIARHQPPH